MKHKHKYIYLTDALGETTWCQDQITDEDTEYVQTKHLPSEEEIRELIKRVVRCNWKDDYDLSAKAIHKRIHGEGNDECR